MEKQLSETIKKMRGSIFAYSIKENLDDEHDHRYRILGTCVCVDPSGIFITAKHLIKNAQSRLPEPEMVYLNNFCEYKENSFALVNIARMIHVEYMFDYDIALIKCGRGKYPYWELKLPTVTPIEGQSIASAGFTLRNTEDQDMRPNVFSGIISRVDLKFFANHKKWNHEHYYLDLKTHNGNSGGPAFTHEGDLIGIISAQRNRILTHSRGDQSKLAVSSWTNLIDCVPIYLWYNAVKTFKENTFKVFGF